MEQHLFQFNVNGNGNANANANLPFVVYSPSPSIPWSQNPTPSQAKERPPVPPFHAGSSTPAPRQSAEKPSQTPFQAILEKNVRLQSHLSTRQGSNAASEASQAPQLSQASRSGLTEEQRLALIRICLHNHKQLGDGFWAAVTHQFASEVGIAHTSLERVVKEMVKAWEATSKLRGSGIENETDISVAMRKWIEVLAKREAAKQAKQKAKKAWKASQDRAAVALRERDNLIRAMLDERASGDPISEDEGDGLGGDGLGDGLGGLENDRLSAQPSRRPLEARSRQEVCSNNARRKRKQPCDDPQSMSASSYMQLQMGHLAKQMREEYTEEKRDRLELRQDITDVKRKLIGLEGALRKLTGVEDALRKLTGVEDALEELTYMVQVLVRRREERFSIDTEE